MLCITWSAQAGSTASVIDIGCVTPFARTWLAWRPKGQIMTKKRNRTRPALSLQERLNKFTEDARAGAKSLPAVPSATRCCRRSATAKQPSTWSVCCPRRTSKLRNDRARGAKPLVLVHQRERRGKALRKCLRPGLVNCGKRRRNSH